jgi:predicted ArsR family transcriptional regulator
MAFMPRNGLRRLATLDEPIRRRIYELVRRARRPMSREEVAVEVGISRKLAAFHLDKLLDRGLLKTHYARPAGRSGPGAGRSAKYYEPSDVEIDVSIPARRYDLAGELLLQAVSSGTPGEAATDAALRVARDRGLQLGETERVTRKLRALGPERAMTVAREILEELGFEPYSDARGELALRNCPFHSLARLAPDLMCAMNQAFIDGMLRGLGNTTVESVLACKAGDCCVTLRAPTRS